MLLKSKCTHHLTVEISLCLAQMWANCGRWDTASTANPESQSIVDLPLPCKNGENIAHGKIAILFDSKSCITEPADREESLGGRSRECVLPRHQLSLLRSLPLSWVQPVDQVSCWTDISQWTINLNNTERRYYLRARPIYRTDIRLRRYICINHRWPIYIGYFMWRHVYSKRVEIPHN